MSKKKENLDPAESSSAERARREAHVEAYRKANPAKADKKLLAKDGKTLITLDEWVDEA